MNSFGRCGGGGRRRAARASTPLIALITTVANAHSAILVDLSPTGARVRGEDLPETADELMFAVEKVRAFGKVAWNAGGECGIEFDGPLPPADVHAVRQAAAATAGLGAELKAAMDDWAVGLAR